MTIVLLVAVAWLVINGLVALGLVAYGRHIERQASARDGVAARWRTAHRTDAPLRVVGH